MFTRTIITASTHYDRIQDWLRPRQRVIDPWALPRVDDLEPAYDDPSLDVRVPYGSALFERETDTLVAAAQRLLRPLPVQVQFAAVFVALEGIRPALDASVRAGLESLGQLVSVLWRVREQLVAAREIRSSLALVVARAPLAGRVIIEGVQQDAARACSHVAYALLEEDEQKAGRRLADAVAAVLIARLDGWGMGLTRPRISGIRRELSHWWRRVREQVAVRDLTTGVEYLQAGG